MKYVLFVCNHNAGRSQMAQAFFEQLAPPDIRVESAGSTPRREVWPTVIEVMAEVGVDLSAARPKKLAIEMQLHADWAVTLGCGDACPFVPTTVEDWDIHDPTGRSLDEVRAIRDEIDARVHDLIDNRLDAIRSDTTAHRARLVRLLPMLAGEFAGARSDAEIRACADAVLSHFDEVPVRSHVMTLAYRRTRDCLAAETCDELVAVP